MPSDFREMTQMPSDFLHNDPNALAYPLYSQGNILMNTWSKASTLGLF
jgi:putative effector of murein hydrolase